MFIHPADRHTPSSDIYNGGPGEPFTNVARNVLDLTHQSNRSPLTLAVPDTADLSVDLNGLTQYVEFATSYRTPDQRRRLMGLVGLWESLGGGIAEVRVSQGRAETKLPGPGDLVMDSGLAASVELRSTPIEDAVALLLHCTVLLDSDHRAHTGAIIAGAVLEKEDGSEGDGEFLRAINVWYRQNSLVSSVESPDDKAGLRSQRLTGAVIRSFASAIDVLGPNPTRTSTDGPLPHSTIFS